MLHERVLLIQAPTPLHSLPRLSEELACEIWVKRDDLTGFAGGGNKGRKLEYLMQEAIASGCDSVITFGAAQSNFIRQCAAACARIGFEFRAAVMDWPYPDGGRRMRPEGWTRGVDKRGNEKLLDLLGVETTLIPDGDWDDLAQAANDIASDMRDAGKKPAVIPAGGSTGVGALGYVSAVNELTGQDLQGFDTIVVASGSGSTQTGLAYGLRRANRKTRVIGICTDNEPEMVEEFERIASELDELLLDNQRMNASDFDLRLGFAGEGYQAKTSEAAAAQRLFARTEGIFLDPVYTAKAGAGLVKLAELGELVGRTLFWHTGGFPGLFVD